MPYRFRGPFQWKVKFVKKKYQNCAETDIVEAETVELKGTLNGSRSLRFAQMLCLRIL